MAEPQIRIRSWIKASASDIRTGLLGYLSVFYGDLVLDGIVLRRTADGRFALSFPARDDGTGKRHPYVRPVDDAARTAIERTLFAQLGQHVGAAVATEDQP